MEDQTVCEAAMRNLHLCALLALPWFAAPAVACLNDRETRWREREFKSQYEQESPGETPAPEENTPGVNLVMAYPRTALGMGGAMALGGLTLGLTRARRKG
jgi:hypothetical protein